MASASRLVIEDSISRSVANASARVVSPSPRRRFACSWRASKTIMKTEKIRIGPKPPTIKRVKYECNEVGGANQ